MGSATAYTDYRFNFRFKSPYLALILLPPTIPLIIMALAMLAWLSWIGASGQLWSVVIAHSVLTAPFAMAVIRLRLNQIDPNLEAAAWNLGASRVDSASRGDPAVLSPGDHLGGMPNGGGIVRRVCGGVVCLGPQQNRAGGHP